MQTLLELAVDDASALSISDQIKSHIRDCIHSGAVAAGQRLPSVRAIARQLDVSITTVEKAVRELALEGMLEGKPGKGTYVRAARQPRVRALRVNSMNCMIEEERKRVAAELAALDPPGAIELDDQDPDVVEVGVEHMAAKAPELEDVDDEVCALYGRQTQGRDIFNPLRACGRLHALPVVWGHHAVCLNPDLFHKAGVPLPSPSWDWAEALELARALTRPEAGQCGFVAVGAWQYFLGLVLQNGGAIFDPCGSVCRLAEPEAVEAAQYLRALAPNGAPDGRRFADIHKDFYEGRTAMLVIDNWWRTHLAGVNGRFPLLARPMPKGRRQAVILRGVGFGIRKSSPARALAHQFLKVLAGIELWPHYVAHHPIVPFHLHLQGSDENTRVFLESFRHAHTVLDDIRPECRTRRHTQALDLLEATIRVIRYTDMPIPGVLAHLRDQINAFIQPRETSVTRGAWRHCR